MNDIFFNKDFDSKTCSEVSKFIINLNKIDNTSPINIYIDSYGGNVYQCLGLISVIEASKVPVYTHVLGCAMSCAFMLAISGHKRFAYKYSTFMYHQVSTNNVYGDIKGIKDDIKEAERIQKIFENIVLSKTNIDKNILIDVFNNRTDWYMSAKEALKLNCIDKII